LRPFWPKSLFGGKLAKTTFCSGFEENFVIFDDGNGKNG
jgi:hypothetical protein